ncbi:MAG: NAD(P)H-dependent oxidoreductase [Eubacterium sp.]
MKTLVITASPLAIKSVSNQLADAFVKSDRKKHPEDKITKIDLSTIEFPSINEDLVNYFNGDNPEGTKKYAFLDRLCQEFCDADRYVFAAPHWNLTTAPSLINYSLAVMRVGTCFAYTEAGPIGLLKNKKALMLLASGGTCQTDNPIMHCYGVDWLKGILKLCGVDDFSIIYAQGIEEYPDETESIINKACVEVELFAEKW